MYLYIRILTAFNYSKTLFIPLLPTTVSQLLIARNADVWYQFTIYFMITSEGIASGLFTLAIIVEAVLTMVIYSQIEKRMIQK